MHNPKLISKFDYPLCKNEWESTLLATLKTWLILSNTTFYQYFLKSGSFPLGIFSPCKMLHRWTLMNGMKWGLRRATHTSISPGKLPWVKLFSLWKAEPGLNHYFQGGFYRQLHCWLPPWLKVISIPSPWHTLYGLQNLPTLRDTSPTAHDLIICL